MPRDYQQIRRRLQSPRQLRLPIRRRHPRFYHKEIDYPVDDPQRSQFMIQEELEDLVHEFGDVAISLAISSAFNLAWPVIQMCHEQFSEPSVLLNQTQTNLLANLEPETWPLTAVDIFRDDAFENAYEIGYADTYPHICADTNMAASHAWSAVYLWNNGEQPDQIAYQLRAMVYTLANSAGLYNHYYMEATKTSATEATDLFIVRWHNEFLSRLAVTSKEH